MEYHPDRRSGADRRKPPSHPAMQFFLDKLFAPLIAAMMGGFAAYMGIREDLREIKVRLAVVEKSADRSQDQIYQINRGGGK